MLMNEKSEDNEERRDNETMEKQFNQHHGARKKEYKPEEAVWVRDFRSGFEKWIPARVKKRYGKAVYDVLTEDDQLWRRHANQMRSGSSMNRRRDSSHTTCIVEGRLDNGMDVTGHQATSTTSLTPTRSSRRRRPPERIQVDPHFKMYRCSFHLRREVL